MLWQRFLCHFLDVCFKKLFSKVTWLHLQAFVEWEKICLGLSSWSVVQLWTLWFSSSLGFSRSSLPWWLYSYRIEVLFAKEWVGIEELLCYVWDDWNLHEQGRSSEVCINMGPCLQSSSSTTGGLPKSEGGGDE